MLGLDTETVDGRARILCTSAGHHLWVSPLLEPQAFAAIVDWIWTTKETSFVAYNMTYDAQAILAWLPREVLWKLERLGRAQYKYFGLEWIRGKRLTITVDRRQAKFYDCFQFYHTSLESASQKYLGSGKQSIVDDGLDVANLGPAIADSARRDKVISYCIRDALLAYQLYQLIEQGLAKVGISGAPISGAYLAGKYFFGNRRRQAPEIMNRLAAPAYYGGRSEMFQRGIYHGKVYCADIHSAYPSQAATLYDPKSLRLRCGKDKTEDAVLGLYHVRVDVDMETTNIGPIPVRSNPLTYPVGTWESWVDSNTLAGLHACGFPTVSLEAIEYCKTYRRPGSKLFPQIRQLYQLREQPELKLAVKLLLNGLYGKLAQEDEWFELTRDPTLATLAEMGQYLVRRREPGPYQDLLLAAHVTGGCRMQLLQAMLQAPESLLMVATDSVWTTQKLDLDYGPGLGQWDCTEADGWLGVMSGIYAYLATGAWRSMSRGFATRESLLELLQQAEPNATTIDVTASLPITALWALKNDRPINEIGTYQRTLDLNSDVKRYWPCGRTTAGQLLARLEPSQPLVYNGGKCGR